jgi:hypothetical protein
MNNRIMAQYSFRSRRLWNKFGILGFHFAIFSIGAQGYTRSASSSRIELFRESDVTAPERALGD